MSFWSTLKDIAGPLISDIGRSALSSGLGWLTKKFLGDKAETIGETLGEKAMNFGKSLGAKAYSTYSPQIGNYLDDALQNVLGGTSAGAENPRLVTLPPQYAPRNVQPGQLYNVAGVTARKALKDNMIPAEAPAGTGLEDLDDQVDREAQEIQLNNPLKRRRLL